jgi:acyl carrier protein
MAKIEEIREIIQGEVSDRIKVEEIPADGLLEDYGIDSLDKASVFMAIEDKYGVSIPDTDMEKLKTLNDIISHIEKKGL